MNWSKLDSSLSSKLSEDPSWLLSNETYSIFVTLENDSINIGQFTAIGISDLSKQIWVKAIRLSGNTSNMA